MLPKGTIAANRVWKRFRADRQRWLLRDEVERLAARFRGNEERGWRWALRDVGLSAEPGDSIGLVGDNGSGKSTFLKILTGVMYPYAGTVRVEGRVGALIEVRAGIHPELTGRENIYLYGSLLGLSRRNVARQFDEIVAFAEVGAAIDRQVKFYSTGMQMRVGFAVAAFLEPDALLVDEVLAVGDASFQQRCLDRMRWMLNQGTTLVFVSHDLAAVEATCSRSVWLSDGAVEADGPSAQVLAAYRRSIEEAAESLPTVDGLVRIEKVIIGSLNGGVPRSHGPLDVELALESTETRPVALCLGISEGPATPIFLVRRELLLNSGHTLARCTIPNLPLPGGRYYLWAAAFEHTDLMPWHPIAQFDVVGPELDPAPLAVVRLAPVHVDAAWDVAQVS